MLRKISVFDQLISEDGEVVSSGQDENGHEVPDSTPMALPVGMSHHVTLAETVARMLRHAKMAQAADEEGFDTPDEADDFDVEDDEGDVLGHMTIFEQHCVPPVDKKDEFGKDGPSGDFQEEKVDGDAGVVEGRGGSGRGGSGRSREERERDAEPEQDADDERSGGEAGRRDPEGSGQDRRRDVKGARKRP